MKIMLDETSEAEYLFSKTAHKMWIFEINVPPKPQKQTQFGRGRAYDPSFLTKKTIQWQVNPHAPKEPLKGAISMNLTFYMPIPKTANKDLRKQMISGAAKPVRRPDIDNLAYIVTNALKGIVYEDDNQICDLILSKRYSETPKTVIKVCEI